MAQSRVQKGKSKKSKFPMWGIGIIVVLVVVIAGYAIVRFSQASSGHSYKTVDNGGLNGGVQTIDKSGYGKFRVVGNNPVTASWAGCSISSSLLGGCSGNEYESIDNQMCVKVYMDPNSTGTFSSSIDTPLSPLNQVLKKQFSSQGQMEVKTVCQDITSITSAVNVTSLKAKVTQSQGKIGVQSIWVVHP